MSLLDYGVVGLYDPALVTVELGLPVPVTVRGIADVDGAIKLTTRQRWTTTEGCDGERMRRRLRGRGGNLQLVLMASSLTLDALTAVRFVDEQTGLGIFPVSILDLNGNGKRVAWAERAWLDGPPKEINFSPGAPPVVVNFELDGLEVVLGSIRRLQGGLSEALRS